jgi:hypothetical protein
MHPAQLSCRAANRRTRFERREFVSDRGIISDQFNPSFTLCLRRIIEALDNAECGARIKKGGRGEIQLQTDAAIEIAEK